MVISYIHIVNYKVILIYNYFVRGGKNHMLSYYSKLSSEVYDIDKYIGLSFGDVEFYRERLASCKGNILEPGVGTGRILIPL